MAAMSATAADQYKKRPEILAPAGDPERLDAALQYGADAVYLAGTQYGMRKGPANFDREEMAAAVKRSHDAHVKVYVTCNTLPRNREIDALPDYLAFLQEAGADALIIADLGVLSLAKRVAPRCAVHISTQTGVVNYETARVLYEMGASRVVLARELSLTEIAELRQRIPNDLEIECFVHGAMCMSVSGRCALSNYLTGRDANRGDCAQPCRWKYQLLEEKRPGQYYTVGEDESGTYLLNANDLCMIEHLAELSGAGVDSFKIEGRAKAAYYVAVTTNAYRMAAEGYTASGFSKDYRPERWMVEELDKVSHRPYGTGFYYGSPSQNTKSGGYIRKYAVAAVAESWSAGKQSVTQRNHFKKGELLDVLEPGKPPFTVPVDTMWNENGEEIDAAPHAMMKVVFPLDRPLVPGSLLRKKLDANL